MIFDTFWHKTLRRPYRLHIQRYGDPAKPTIVLLHGIAASGEDWAPFVQVLTKEYYCITIDLLGFGKSPKPQWCKYSIDDHTRSLFYSIHALRNRELFILMGHSLGSFLAARYAHEHPSSLSRLYLLSPPVYPPLNAISKRGARRLTGLLLVIYKFLRNEHMTPDTFRRLSYIAPLPKSVVRQPDIWIPFMRTLQTCIEQQHILSDVAALELPVKVFYGTLDQVVVGANVELLTQNSYVQTQTFIGTHDLTLRYAKYVLKSLKL